ncbi:hypothetical protein HELRODRAFT_183206 [Helobdella robusta]|uniref:Uncharacterized protein n=1 Tax=Helobdella robusta TaxID=6412 RepID=T1FJB1_HELRO|nr:hypothetical protein HELRODRAFT_183206 [Helobdella robusta]ESO11420.1 hypothetical protein HELRODRAFT_183206 [Helobdella robusta]
MAKLWQEITRISTRVLYKTKFKGVGVHRAENLDTYWQEFHRGEGVPIFFHFMYVCIYVCMYVKSTIESDSECDNFVLVKRKKRNNHPNRNDNSNSVPRVVVGSRAPTKSKITANKVVFQKRIFHIGNVTKCVASDVVDHLRLSQVEVVSCFPAFKKDKNGVKPDDSQPSTSFRLCVDAKYSDMINKECTWSEHVRVRD